MAKRVGWQAIARRIRVPLGFVFAGLFLWLAQPSVGTIAWSLVLVGPGLWLRGYAAGYVRKNAELTTTGPYGYTRNPLYLGSMMIASGFAVAGGRWSIGLALAALFLGVYLPTIRSEEEFLRRKFAGFDDYAARVPRLLPSWVRPGMNPIDAAATGSNAQGKMKYRLGSFSRELYLHHREYNAVMGAGAIYTALAIRIWLRR